MYPLYKQWLSDHIFFQQMWALPIQWPFLYADVDAAYQMALYWWKKEAGNRYRYLNGMGLVLLTWFNFNPGMDK